MTTPAASSIRFQILALLGRVVALLSRHGKLLELLGMLLVLYAWSLNLDGYETYRAAHDDLDALAQLSSRGHADMMTAANVRLQSSLLLAAQTATTSTNPAEERLSYKRLWDSPDVRRDWLERTFGNLLALSMYVESLQDLADKYGLPRVHIDELKAELDAIEIILRPLADSGRTGWVYYVPFPKEAITTKRAEEFDKSLAEQAQAAFGMSATLDEILLAKRMHFRDLYRYAFVCGTLLLALGKFFDWRKAANAQSAA